MTATTVVQAIFPRADGSTANMQDYLIDSSNTASDDNADSNPVSKDLVKKIMSSAKGEDDTPLTTKAFRDLQKAQKAKVYSKSLIRVK